jgi:hypothetical protein
MTVIQAIACFVAICVVVAPSHIDAQEQLTPETVSRITRLLEGSGYRYSKVSDRSWSIVFKGAHRPSIDVFVSANNEKLALIAVVAYKKDVTNPAEAALRLLRFNHDAVDATVAIDNDEDFVVTRYYDFKRLDTASFKTAVETIAQDADAAYSTVKALAVAANAPAGNAGATSTSSTTFRVSPAATQRVEILAGRALHAFDPQKWVQQKSDEPGRLQFAHRNGDGYAMLISERVEIALPALREIALENARKLSPDLTVTHEEKRTVNGTDVLMMQLEAMASGVRFSFVGYYWAGSAGSVQVVAYTGRNLLDEYRSDFEAFLNGFQVKK